MLHASTYLVGELEEMTIGKLPFIDMENLRNILKERFEYDLGNTERTILVGDTLTTNILFGNLNNMATIYCN